MEKLFDGKDSVTYRFGCSCYEPGHALDVEVQKDRLNDVIFYMYTLGETLRFRLRWCWKMLRTGEGFDYEIVLREQDVPELARILTEAGKVRDERQKS